MNNYIYDKVKIITVAKVGSANFLHCDYKKDVKKIHTHNLKILKRTLEKDRDCLIIVGIRNPIDRNLSYLFQTFRDKHYNDVKTFKNGYKGEFCYIPSINLKTKPQRIIELYFNQIYHNTFNEWFKEFIEITNIKNFNKEEGIDFYEFKNNNRIMLYTLEKLNSNEKEICELIGVENLNNINDSNNKEYKEIYLRVKNEIKYDKSYLDNLLDTEIMKLFYTQSDINEMYLKYKTNNN